MAEQKPCGCVDGWMCPQCEPRLFKVPAPNPRVKEQVFEALGIDPAAHTWDYALALCRTVPRGKLLHELAPIPETKLAETLESTAEYLAELAENARYARALMMRGRELAGKTGHLPDHLPEIPCHKLSVDELDVIAGELREAAKALRLSTHAPDGDQETDYKTMWEQS